MAEGRGVLEEALLGESIGMSLIEIVIRRDCCTTGPGDYLSVDPHEHAHPGIGSLSKERC
jgi:hypothetical protein